MSIEVHHYIHLDGQLEKLALGKLDQILEGINKLMATEKDDVAAVVAAVADLKQTALDMEARVDTAIANATGPNATLEQAAADLQALKGNFAGFHAAIATVGGSGTGSGVGGSSSGGTSGSGTGDTSGSGTGTVGGSTETGGGTGSGNPSSSA